MNDDRPVLDQAELKGLNAGNAPDTFLNGRWQTICKLLDFGRVGAPTGCAAFVGTHGTERHNPNPDFYYRLGGGPMLDLGPYYLSAMVFLLGPVARVAGMPNRAFDRRMIENGPRHGDWMEIEVDTHVQGMLEFESGAIGSITMSFDIWDSEMPRFEFYGTAGTIGIPDPDPGHGANVFQGEVWWRERATSRWTHQPRPSGRDHWQVAKLLRRVGLSRLGNHDGRPRRPRNRTLCRYCLAPANPRNPSRSFHRALTLGD